MTFVDSDDWIPPYAVEGFLKAASSSGAPVVVSATYAVDSLEVSSSPDFRWTVERPALKRLVGRRKMQSSAWNKFYRADVLQGRRFIEGIYFEDWPFVTELFGDVEFFALLKEPMYVYCKNGGGVSIVRSPFNARKVASYLCGVEHVNGHFNVSHPQRNAALKRIAAALTTMIGKVCKSNSAELSAHAVAGIKQLADRYPEVLRCIGLKARYRLWQLSRRE